MNRLESGVEKLTAIRAKGLRVAQALEEAMKVSPYRLGRDARSEMVSLFNTIPDSCAGFNRSLTSATHYIAEACKLIDAKDIDERAVQMVQDDCLNAARKVPMARAIVNQLRECIRLREQHIAMLRSLPPKAEKSEESAEQKRVRLEERTQLNEAFTRSQSQLEKASRNLNELERITRSSTSSLS